MTANPVTTQPLSPLRKAIAARMVEAKQTIPHYRITMDIRMDALLALRKKLNAENPAIKLSVNDFIIKACAEALMKYPALNCQCVDNQVHYYAAADISVVVAVDGGLSTPVVRAANTKTLQQIALDVQDLAVRAKERKLKGSEIQGGTFSLSNLGSYGVDQFDAIINAPQCAILAVGRARLEPLEIQGQIKLGMVMRASLSLDHRVIDGAVGAQFLQFFREHLEVKGE